MPAGIRMWVGLKSALSGAKARAIFEGHDVRAEARTLQTAPLREFNYLTLHGSGRRPQLSLRLRAPARGD